MPGRQSYARPTGPLLEVAAPMSDSTFVVVSTAPGADGRYWTFVDAFGEDEAMRLVAKELPAPSLAFRVPTQRTRGLAKAFLTYGVVIAPAAILLIPFLTFQFRRSGSGFVVLGWAQAFGYAILFEVMVLFLVLAYLAILDFACARVGSRTLRERAKVMPDGTVLDGPEVQDVIDAFGPERVARTVQLVNRAFGAGLLLVLLAGWLTR